MEYHRYLWMRAIYVLFFLLSAQYVAAAFWGFDGQRDAYTAFVWEANMPSFEASAYEDGVERLFLAFEERTGKPLVPGLRRSVGIKIDTAVGIGLSTPKPLVKAVISALRRRGFAPSELFLIDAAERPLRDSGFIPPLSSRQPNSRFAGIPVRILDSGCCYDPVWFYESPLAPVHWEHSQVYQAEGEVPFERKSVQQERKSLLPKPLIDGVDFWINLPVVIDHPALGVRGSLANASLWNIGNRERFFSSKTNAPLAAAEILAIPELLANKVFTILSLEAYQYIGGPGFNAAYLGSEPLLWLSVNPGLLDALILERMNKRRIASGFRPLENIALLPYAENVGIGPVELQSVRWIP